jgi:hypothetical protein
MVRRNELGAKEKKREVVESRADAQDRVRREELRQLRSFGLWAFSKRARVQTSQRRNVIEAASREGEAKFQSDWIMHGGKRRMGRRCGPNTIGN